MTIESDDPEGLLRSGESDDAEQVCRRVGEVVGPLLLEEFSLPPKDVAALLQDAYRKFKVFRHELRRDPQEWLVRRIVSTASEFMERRGYDAGLDSEEEKLHLLDVVRLQAALDTLPRSVSAALRLMYGEGKSSEEIAEELDVSVVYANRLLSTGLRLLKEWRPRRPREE